MVVPQQHGSHGCVLLLLLGVFALCFFAPRVANAVGGFVTRQAIFHTGQLNTQTILPLIRQKPGPTENE